MVLFLPATAAAWHNVERVLHTRLVALAGAAAALGLMWSLGPRLLARFSPPSAGERVIMWVVTAASLAAALTAAIATVNCMASWRTPQRFDARAVAKYPGGRRENPSILFATPRGAFTQEVHRQFYASVRDMDVVDLRLCRGVLGLEYFAHPGLQAPVFFEGEIDRSASAARRARC